jgi:hypothetical protein
MIARIIFLLVSGSISLAGHGQSMLINGDFEDDYGPTVSGWSYNCWSFWSLSNAAPNGGTWSIALEIDAQSDCQLTQFYQLLPQVQDGEPLILSGWARVVQGSPITPAMIGIGSLHNGSFNVQEWVQTDSYEWNFLTLSWTASLVESAIAFVILRPGNLSPSGIYSIVGFDGLQLTPGIVAVHENDVPQLHFHRLGERLLVAMADSSPIQSMALYDVHGKLVQENDGVAATREFNTSGLKAGIYIVKVQSATSIAIQKISHY